MIKVILLIALFMSGQNIAQETDQTFVRHFSQLDSALVLQTKEPAHMMTSKYFQKIIPNIIITLNNDTNINQKKTLLRYWFIAQEKFVYSLNHQPVRVSCSDSLCLRHNLIRNRKEKTVLHKDYGLEISGEPCYQDDTPPPLIYLPSISIFKNYAKLFKDEEFLNYLELLEFQNRKVLRKEYFKCLDSPIVCDLILLYEKYMERYPHSEFGNRVWHNYSELTMQFLSLNMFFEWYGDANRMFSEVLVAYEKYLDQSNNEKLSLIISKKLSELLKIENEYYIEKDYRVKQKFLKKILFEFK